MKIRQACLAALIFLGASPLAAIGADRGAAGLSDSTSSTADSPAFRAVDTNRDGFVSRREAQASADLNARFDQFDSDRDGKLSQSEWQAGQAGQGAAGVSGISRGKDAPAMIP